MSNNENDSTDKTIQACYVLWKTVGPEKKINPLKYNQYCLHDLV